MQNGKMRVSNIVKVTSPKMGNKDKWKTFEDAWVNSKLSLLARFLYTAFVDELFRVTKNETLKSAEFKVSFRLYSN